MLLSAPLAFTNTGLGQFIIYAGSTVVAGIVTGVGLFVVKTIRESRDDFFSALADVKEMKTRQAEFLLIVPKVNDMYETLVGAAPTALNPNPGPGLVEQVDYLVHDSKRNNGSSGRDQIDRIAKAVGAEEGPTRPRRKRAS